MHGHLTVILAYILTWQCSGEKYINCRSCAFYLVIKIGSPYSKREKWNESWWNSCNTRDHFEDLDVWGKTVIKRNFAKYCSESSNKLSIYIYIYIYVCVYIYIYIYIYISMLLVFQLLMRWLLIAEWLLMPEEVTPNSWRRPRCQLQTLHWIDLVPILFYWGIGCWGEYLGLGETREQRSGGNFIMRNFIICTPHPILFWW